MNQEVKKFYDAITNDEALRAKAGEVNRKFAEKKPSDDDAAEAIVAFAAGQGFSFTKGDLEAYSEELKKDSLKALSEDELAAVAGGVSTETQSGECVRCFVKLQCFCFAGGGGQHHEPDWTCVCIAAGGGGHCSKDLYLFCLMLGDILPMIRWPT